MSSTDEQCNCTECPCTNLAFADSGDPEPVCDDCQMGDHMGEDEE